MKYLKRLKGMKIGIASSLAYIGLSFLPVSAQTPQTLNLDNIQTIDQLKQVYQEKLAEYCQDKKVNIQEIKNLNKIIKKGESLEDSIISDGERENSEQYKEVKQQLQPFYEETDKLTAPLRKLNYKIESEKEKLAKLEKEAEDIAHLSVYEAQLKNIRQEVENIFVSYYPGLLKGNDSEYNVNYSAEKKIALGVEEIMLPLLKQADEIFREVYQKNSIEPFLHRDLTLQELIVFREILKSTPDIKPPQKDYVLLKAEKSELIQQLKQEKSQITEKTSLKLKGLDAKIEVLEKKLGEISNRDVTVSKAFSLNEPYTFQKYMERIDDIEHFTKYNADLSKYFSLSLFGLTERYDESDHKDIRNKLGDGKYVISNLEDYFKSQGFDVKITDKLPNPGKPKWPFWLGLPLAIGLPIPRNLLALKYVSNGKASEDDYVGDALLGVGEILAFWLFSFDAFHPLVLPIRLVAMPLVWHGLFKATGWNKSCYDYAKR